MPQMSPLMWFYLFILFSGLLLLSFIKIYFFSDKTLEQKSLQSFSSAKKINWVW